MKTTLLFLSVFLSVNLFGQGGLIDLDAILHSVNLLDLENVTSIEMESGIYDISVSGDALNNSNGGDDLFYGVVLFYQDSIEADGNRSVYRVIQPGETITSIPIGVANVETSTVWAFLLEKNTQSNNSGTMQVSFNSSTLDLQEVTLTSSKNRIQILDFMGRETSFKPNTPLIYVYDDGSIEKVFSVEY